MTSIPIAHAGHWTGLIYAIPVLVIGALMGWDALRQRRRDADGDSPDDSTDQGPG